MSNDPNYSKLASILTGFSTNLKEGERVLIDVAETPDAMVIELIRAARKLGAIPYVQVQQSVINRELLKNCSEGQYATASQWEIARMKKMDAYIAIRGSHNIFEQSDIPPENMAMAMKEMKSVLDWRVQKTRWVVLRWPTSSMAQQAGMSTEAFEDFYFKVCTLDYSKMIPGMKALKKAMEKTDKVQIKGPGTDLEFSIKGIPAIPCGGNYNIPDGEVFTAPVKDSVNGTITYNAPTTYQGKSFDNIKLTFKKGKIVEATSSDTNSLNEILDSDKGARFIGEFAIGFNPYILEPMRDILFDEKIAGSFHFTPGQAYEEADNGNRSQVHWDMVNIQRSEYGGGEIIFDGKVIRRDGIFLPKALQKLNPENLVN